MSVRWSNKDFVFDKTTKRMTMSFDVESDQGDVNDYTLIYLALDCIYSLVEENEKDAEFMFREVISSKKLM